MADLFHMPRADAFDGSGNPRAGAKLYFYAAGTSTPQSVYTDQDLSIAHANPVVADANGVWAGIWLQDLDYKVILKDSADVTIWTQDNVHGPQFEAAAAVDDSSQLQYIGGLNITANATDANNDIDIAAGSARNDASTVTITLSDVMTKRLDAAWAAGTNQGGLDTGSKQNSTTYYVYVIRETDSGDGDVLISASSSNPTMPSGWGTKRRIGEVRTNASGNIYYVGNWVRDYVPERETYSATEPVGEAAGDRWNDTSIANAITRKLYDGAAWIATIVIDTLNDRVSKIGAALFMNASQIGVNRAPTATADVYASGSTNTTALVSNDTITATMRVVGTTQAEFGATSNHRVAIIQNGADRFVFPTSGGFQLASNAAILRVRTGSGSLDFPSVAAEGGDEDLTITVSGAQVGDGVILRPPSALSAGFAYIGFVSAADTVTIRAVNTTHIADNPPSGTWGVIVIGV